MDGRKNDEQLRTTRLVDCIYAVDNLWSERGEESVCSILVRQGLLLPVLCHTSLSLVKLLISEKHLTTREPLGVINGPNIRGP